jgi:hypothetical protein
MGAGTGCSVSMSEVVYIAGCRARSVVKYLVGRGSRENWQRVTQFRKGRGGIQVYLVADHDKWAGCCFQ